MWQVYCTNTVNSPVWVSYTYEAREEETVVILMSLWFPPDDRNAVDQTNCHMQFNPVYFMSASLPCVRPTGQRNRIVFLSCFIICYIVTVDILRFVSTTVKYGFSDVTQFAMLYKTGITKFPMSSKMYWCVVSFIVIVMSLHRCQKHFHLM